MIKQICATAAAVGLAVTVAACSGGGNQDRFLTEKVATGDIEKTVIGTGVLQPLVVVDVGAQASGQIKSLNVDVGDIVAKGQLIAVIDPATQEAALRNAEAALNQARAQKASQQASLDQSRLELQRQQTLLGKGYVSQSVFDSAQATVKVAEAQLNAIDAQIHQAQINVEKAQVDLSRTNIYAPIDGVVADVIAREGQTVVAIQTAPTIVRLAKLDTMTVRAQISEADVVGVHAGQTVYFTILGQPDRRFYGKLRAIEPAPDNATADLTGQANQPVYYNAVFEVPNPDGTLRPGMTAEVYVVLNEVKGVLTMPSAALHDPNADGTYTIKVLNARGKPEDRKVRIGVDNNIEAQVLDGLKAGDEVVVSDAWDASVTGLPAGQRPGGGRVEVSN